jgi:thiol-disulfide isomerase/thioredoxin
MKLSAYVRFAWLAALITACGQAAGADGSPATANNATAQTPAAAVAKATLRDYGAAPELQNTVWLNTPGPLRLADLRGQVVLLNMWTFDCINCQHVIPYVKTWYDAYHAQGLQVIGNHFPEFQYEADLGNLTNAVKQLGLRYPIAQDNDGQTWRAYDTHYWPTIFLIDKRGHIRYQSIGEGAYPQTEAAIQSLLAESYP